MNEPNCESCRRPMPGADQVEICRLNGLPTSAANADGCKHYEAAAVPADRVWYGDDPVCGD